MSAGKIIHNNQESIGVYKSAVWRMPTNVTCAVRGCKNYYYKTRDMSDGGYPITYHYLPREYHRRLHWLSALSNTSQKNLFVCSIHFEPDDFFWMGTKRLLKVDAFPTQNLKLSEISSYNGCDTQKNSSSDEHSYGPVVVISDTEEEEVEEIVGNGNNSLDSSSEEQMKLLKTKYEQLLSAYEAFKTSSEVEIKKLKLEVKHKDKECSKKLRKILSEFLSETEIDLALFLRKQKKETAS